MTAATHPPATREIAQQRRALAPGTQAAFDVFGRAAFAEGALPAKTKQIVSAPAIASFEAEEAKQKWPSGG